MTAALQTVRHIHRQRRKGRVDPFHPLARTHRFVAADTNIDTDAKFGARDLPISIRFELVRTGAANGIVIEFGDAARGLAAWVNGNDVGFAVGEGTAAPNNGVGVTMTDALSATGVRFTFVCAALPGTGEIRLWRNGTMQERGVSVAGDLNGAWSSIANGSVGAVQGAVTDRVPVAARVAMTNCDIVSPVLVAYRQLPPQFARG